MDHLELKIKKIPDLSTRIKTKISKKEMITMKRRSKKNLTYISWLDNERRLRNLITP
ncbi:MAG: hypothetical protein M3P82_00860 [Bacteroidota bacterium]|nr:hypothetical protein [Bacteroidota bacterium]